jgi:hypothetical protein
MTHIPPWRSLLVCSVTLATLSLYAPVAAAQTAHCDRNGVCTPPAHLPWRSPSSITDGVAATFRSIKPCPNVRSDGSPLQGTREVEVFVQFSFGGGMGDVAPVNADGSWTFVKTFDAGGAIDPSATVTMSCLDVTVTGIDIADYQRHRIAVNP